MTQTLNFDQLPRFQPRRFVPGQADLTDPDTIAGLFDALLKRPLNATADLEAWLADRSELGAAVSQQAAEIYILMTCQTDDPKRAQAHKDFVERVEPVLKLKHDAMNRKFIESLARCPLDEARYGLLIREVQADLETFREANVPLQTQEDLLGQEYQTISGAMTVQFRGKEHTLAQMGKYLVEPDRALREDAWRASAARRLQEKDKLDGLFDRMLALRVQIAGNAGFANYRDYKFKTLKRFDYTPEDCKQYHRSIEKLVVPIWGRILEAKAHTMKLDRLRPWDLGVDELGKAPLKPFEQSDELIKGCQRIFEDMDPELGAQFADMARRGLLDLDNRKGKAPGGYQHGLAEARLPFIFMNAVGLDSDMRTLLHEAGHAFHSLACRHHPLIDYRHGPMEFNEVASMAMEMLPEERISVFYKEEEIRRSIVSHLKDVVNILVWVAIVDAFQHWIYENPSHTAAARAEAWVAIHRRFGVAAVDWSGLDAEQRYLWHRQLHIFEVPFYYIEYGIAQLGALQLWLNARRDPAKALADYKRGLSLGGSRPLPELYAAAGIRFDFSERTIAPLMEAVLSEMKEKNPHF